MSDSEATEDRDRHEGIAAGLLYLWREPVLRRLTVAWFVFVVGMGMGMVADAPLATRAGWGSTGYGLMIAMWGLGSTLGAGAGRWMTARTESRWLVAGAAGIAVSALLVGYLPIWIFVLILASLLTMGVCDGLTIVAENSMMQRRTPDAVRSRAMAAFDAVLSFGLAIAYIAAIPVMRVIQPQSVYRVGGVGAVIAVAILLPLWRLRGAGEEVLEAPGVREAEHTVSPLN